jgi:glycosyltransferase involved in cell wall biosynthesis
VNAEGKKKRSCVWLLPSLAGGGAERTVVNLTAALQARGINCAIGVLQSIEAYPTNVDVERIEPSLVSRPELWPFIGRKRLRQFEASRDADATISFTTFANLLNARASDSIYPRYISIRSTLSRALFGPTGIAYRHLMQRYYPQATKVIAISKFVADDAVSLLKLDPAHVHTIYNPVPIEDIERWSREPLYEPWDSELRNRFTIVAVGRLSAEKGHAHLLRVVAAMRHRGSKCRVLIAGKGPRLADYVTLAKELGLVVATASDPLELQKAADVVFLGFVRNPFAFMREAHAFAFPSALEGFGQALLEAVASGATIVASDCDSGPREILAPSTDYRRRTHGVEETPCGWLVPPPTPNWRSSETHTVQGWVDAFEHLQKHAPDTRRACRERAADFGIETTTNAWVKMLGW